MMFNQNDWIEQGNKKIKVKEKINPRNQVTIRASDVHDQVYLKISLGINISKSLMLKEGDRLKPFLNTSKNRILLSKTDDHYIGYKLHFIDPNKGNYNHIYFLTTFSKNEVILNKTYVTDVGSIPEGIVIILNKILIK